MQSVVSVRRALVLLHVDCSRHCLRVTTITLFVTYKHAIISLTTTHYVLVVLHVKSLTFWSDAFSRLLDLLAG